MSTDLAIKIYKPDYGFIIDNYLDPNQWGKEYTIYQYKKFDITICLSSIDTIKKELTFKLRYRSGDRSTTGELINNYTSTIVRYSLDNDEYTVDILIKKINQSIEYAIKEHYGIYNYHYTYCMRLDSYIDEKNVYKEEFYDVIVDLYDDLPDIVQNMFHSKSDFIDDYITDVIGAEPYRKSSLEKYYIQELNIFKGIQQQITNADYGNVEIKIDEGLAAAIKLQEGEDLTDEENYLYEEWKESTLEEIQDNFEDNVQGMI